MQPVQMITHRPWGAARITEWTRITPNSAGVIQCPPIETTK